MYKYNEITELIGKTMIDVRNEDNEEMIFITDNNETYKFYHDQDCCESVTIEDICGDLADLIGSPLLMAEEVSYEDENPESVKIPEYQGSFTWTFYKFATNKGAVTVRWYGESNGDYSEYVDFMKVGG